MVVIAVVTGVESRNVLAPTHLDRDEEHGQVARRLGSQGILLAEDMAGEGDQVSRRGFELCNSGHLGAFGWGRRGGGEEAGWGGIMHRIRLWLWLWLFRGERRWAEDMELGCYRGEVKRVVMSVGFLFTLNRTGPDYCGCYCTSTHCDVACSLLWKKRRKEKLAHWWVGWTRTSMQARYTMDPPASRGTSRIGRSS
jgi:hypothetical protein